MTDDQNYYQQTIDACFEKFDSTPQGLSEQDAKNRFEQAGPNKLTEEKTASPWQIFLAQFRDPLIYILIIAAIFTTIVGEYIDMWVILAVILINAVVGFFQEYKAEKAMEAIKKLASPKAVVIRDKQEKRVPATELVPGDVILLESGEKVPADIRLIETRGLHVDESMLTGESKPSPKHTDMIEDKNIGPGDQNNMSFMGTVVTEGKGNGIVVATGQDTQLGEISKQVQKTEKEKTPLQKRLIHFSKIIGVLAMGLALLVAALGFIQGRAFKEMILFSISMAVGAIPEGLPVVITITMAIGLKRMADRNAIVRKLIAVETLGSCNVICSDKTGTITENKMTVRQAWTPDDQFFTFQGEGYQPEGDIQSQDQPVQENEPLKQLLRCGLLCNNAKLEHEADEWNISGDPTEGALVVSASKYGLKRQSEMDSYTFIDEVPFSSQRKFMASLFKTKDQHILFVKGAPEKMISFCQDPDTEKWRQKNHELATEGLRVLAFGIKSVKKSADLEKEAQQGLTFLGFQGIIDPPRQSALEAIKQTKRSGIQTIMVTGDNIETAKAIAQKSRILDEGDEAITGQEIDEKGEDYLREHSGRIRVYARVSPTHKLKIVEALQSNQKIVAVTGDGVNDAPALKKGTIGIAMGASGTDVAREASEMILKDDNFATIVEAVKVGRIIFDNIRKVIFFLLSSSAGVVSFIIFSLLLNLPLPFVAAQVLWVNLVTNGLQDIALAYEPGEADVAERPPREPKENIINAFLLRRLTIVGLTIALGTLGMFMLYLNREVSLIYARTVAFNMVVFFQFFHVFNCRSFTRSIFTLNPLRNLFLLVAIVLALIAQMAVIYWPPLQYVFKTVPINTGTWIEILSVSALIIVVFEIDKWVRRKWIRKK
jgi:Ca2+-transporting ATPase